MEALELTNSNTLALTKSLSQSVSFRTTVSHIKADILRRLVLEKKPCNTPNFILAFANRGTLSVLIYRIKRYLHGKNNVFLSLLIKIIRYIEFQLCHNEIDPRAIIGPGFVIVNSGGVSLSFSNIIGKNCTFMGYATPTLGAMEDVDLNIDRIVIGDYCTLSCGVRIINNVSIANGVQIKPNSVLMHSIHTPGAVVSGFPARQIAVIDMEKICRWSPIKSDFIEG